MLVYKFRCCLSLSFTILIFLIISCSKKQTVDNFLEATSTLTQVWKFTPQSQRFQVQFADYPPDLSIDADIYEVDLFETPTETIRALHAMGRYVVCYINAGAWEEYRPDADDFPEDVIGRKYSGWPGEKWLDISRYDLFASIMENRFDLAAEKGCDAVETDNVQGYQEPTGFEISFEHQLEYNRWLSGQAHTGGLAIGLKNDPEQVMDLEPWFDFALVEECAAHDECEMYLPFIQAGKPVFQIEYTDQFKSTGEFCPLAESHGYYGLLKNRQLDSWVAFCR